MSSTALAAAENSAMPRAAARRRRKAIVPYLYLAPLLVLLITFTYWPLLQTAYLSVTKWNLNPGQPVTFVGLDNYRNLITGPIFWGAAWNTLVYIVAAIPLEVLLPIPIAVFLWSLGGRGHVYRTILFLPTLLSFVVVAIAWLWLLSPLGGYLQQLAGLFGWAMPNLLAGTGTAIWTIVGLAAWKVFGFNLLLYLAGLATIDRSLVEAMRIDGAGDLTLLRHLVWPLLTPTTLVVLVATVIFTVQQVFTPIDLMTQGGPAGATTNLFYMVYQYAFVTFNVGAGAAGTVILFALLAVIALAKLRFFEARVHYER